MTVAEQWMDYRNRVVSQNATANQLFQLKTAFYAGFFVSIIELLNLADKPDDDAIASLEALKVEAQAYLEEVKNCNET